MKHGKKLKTVWREFRDPVQSPRNFAKRESYETGTELAKTCKKWLEEKGIVR